LRSEAEIKKQIEEIKEKEKYARKEANLRLKFSNNWYHDIKESEANRLLYARRILEWVLDEQIKFF
jgi:hypothetical protein